MLKFSKFFFHKKDASLVISVDRYRKMKEIPHDCYIELAISHFRKEEKS
jgi:hypothetical protein